MNIILLIIILILILLIIYNKYYNIELLDESFYDVNDIFPKLNSIKQHRVQLLKELNNILNDRWNLWPETELYKNGEWKIYPLFAFGIWVDDNCEKMPTLTRFIKSIPGLKLATLSKMSANMELTPHKGWGEHSNNVLRCHYGLIVPENQCYISVTDDYNNKENQYHKNNEWLVFDDAKTHWATNKSNKDRIVLIIDIERPINVKHGTSDIGNTKELLEIVDYFKHKNLINQ